MNDSLLLGAIADDYTGGADLASRLSEQGVRTLQILGLQPDDFVAQLGEKYQAVVIAVKTRGGAPGPACEAARRALAQLRRLRARQIYFKYSSTFDSTPAGNIGPVMEALMEALGADFTVAVPALPIQGRTQYQGHLFVGSRLLSESPMRHHPATPMTDANLVRHLQAQTRKTVGLIPHSVVRAGAESLRAEISRLRAQRVAIALVDIIYEADLACLADAVADLPLITGGSGLAIPLPSTWSARGLWRPDPATERNPAPPSGGILILSGSCSEATLQQLAQLRAARGDGLRMNVLRLLSDQAGEELNRLRASAVGRLHETGCAWVYSSAGPDERESLFHAARAQGLSPDQVRGRIEHATGELARDVVAQASVDSLVIAGGDTAGAIMDALAIRALELGPTIDPGVPVARSVGGRALRLVCKSGNFGSPNFFEKAIRILQGEGFPPKAESASRETLEYPSS